MRSFHIGQRWISKMEPELGLGIIQEIQNKTVLVYFPAANCQRHYAKDTAPLQRVEFKSGDTITSKKGKRLTVNKSEEIDGLLIYRCDDETLHESDLCDTLSFSTPQDRLLSGLIDNNRAFNLRFQTLIHRYTLLKSHTHGFLGGRIDLLPHQLYIAKEVCHRAIPRVLLCDEVGLGKTIEACLILHRLLLTGKVNRIIILVPESIMNQWFVELLRKFNLLFRMVNNDFLQTIEGSDQKNNPFLSDSLFLCPLEILSEQPLLMNKMNTTEWDLIIVDEAHHLTEGSASYQIVEVLGKKTQGLILLTATPQQFGYHSHFARLRLLDPNRYHDFESFKKETDQYQETAILAEKLLAGEKLTKNDLKRIQKGSPKQIESDRETHEIIKQLLDRHGIGRVLFRNTRSVIKGFPKRRVHLIPLDADDRAIKALTHEFKCDIDNEVMTDCDYSNDPRVRWISQWLKTHPDEKILLISQNIQKVDAINRTLKNRIKVDTALFHENLTLIQRDKNAAWFSRKNGARILICSEIGSEGRNFQFAHHLVLFDIPLNPELLEQRIGRLDRIGQKENIHIHVPFVKGTPQELLIQWYHHALNAFEYNLLDGYEIAQQFGEQLRVQIVQQNDISDLISKTSVYHKILLKQMKKGRDRLLELHSFHQESADKIITEINQWDQNEKSERFTTRLFSHFGIRLEEIADRTYRFHFELLENPDFPIPPLRESNLIGTFDRSNANQREDIEFLTWDHPMLTGAMELLLSSDNGNCTIALWTGTDVREVLLETIFLLETVAPPELFCDRFLPAIPIRILTNNQQEDKSDMYIIEEIAKLVKDAPNLTPAVKSMMSENIPLMMSTCKELAEKKSRSIIGKAENEMNTVLNDEINRLIELKKINPNIRDEEIQLLQKEKAVLQKAIESARLRLDSIRLILKS